ncbi:hypothetical protein K8I28_03980 [bacterium]|nr:hypothetical protein [bacterium]
MLESFDLPALEGNPELIEMALLTRARLIRETRLMIDGITRRMEEKVGSELSKSWLELWDSIKFQVLLGILSKSQAAWWTTRNRRSSLEIIREEVEAYLLMHGREYQESLSEVHFFKIFWRTVLEVLGEKSTEFKASGESVKLFRNRMSLTQDKLAEMLSNEEVKIKPHGVTQTRISEAERKVNPLDRISNEAFFQLVRKYGL